jgi:low affinity Fe/Cu permease
MWEVTALSVLVFLAIFAIVGRITDWSLFKDIILSVGATCSVLWCLWVVRTFRDIMTWWIYMHQRLDSVGQLLAEAKQDLNELKTIKQEK